MLEKFIANLMQQAGISPEQIVHAYQLVMTWQAEIDAFKAGTARAVQHFDQRLTEIAKQQTECLAMLVAIADKVNVDYVSADVPTVKPNGEDHPHV